MTKIRHKIDLLVLFVFPILLYQGYKIILLNTTILKLLYFVLLFLMILYIGNYWFVRVKSPIFKVLRCLFLALLFSIAMSFLFWGQSPILGYRASASSLVIVLYFFLRKEKITESILVKFSFFYCFLWLLVYFIALLVAPFSIFMEDEINLDSNMASSRGILRFFIFGDEVIYFVFFFFLNKIYHTKDKRYLYVLATIFMFVVIVMQVTRQTIIFSFILALFFIFKQSRNFIKPLLLLMFFLPIAGAYFLQTDIYKGLSELSQEQKADYKSNTRLLEYEYYFFNFPQPNLLTVLFGNGAFHTDSNYGKMEQRIRDGEGFFRSDVGYASIFIETGLFGLSLMMILIFYIVRIKVPPQKFYLKVFLYFMILYNIASAHFYCVFTFVALYLLTNDKNKHANIINYYKL